jgi:hypothetical protein
MGLGTLNSGSGVVAKLFLLDLNQGRRENRFLADYKKFRMRNFYYSKETGNCLQ